MVQVWLLQLLQDLGSRRGETWLYLLVTFESWQWASGTSARWVRWGQVLHLL